MTSISGPSGTLARYVRDALQMQQTDHPDGDTLTTYSLCGAPGSDWLSRILARALDHGGIFAILHTTTVRRIFPLAAWGDVSRSPGTKYLSFPSLRSAPG